jgi:acetolactate synthase-1/2/3 large subunit
MTKITGNQQLAEMLRDYGVSHVFFVPTIRMASLAAMDGMGIQRIMTHGEKAAVYMADGYARAAHRPGICMAQHIGASNLAAGLRDPFMSCSPIIAITGGEMPTNRYRHAYQDIEDFSQFEPVTKMNCQVEDVRRLPDLLRQAFRAATCGTPGPVHLQLRGNHGQILDSETDVSGIVEPQYATVPPFRPAPDPEALRKAVMRIAAAQRPIVVAGGGVVASDARRELVAFCEAFALPIATSLSAKDCVLDTHPLNVGVPGSYSRRCANEAVAAADLVVFVGCQTGGMVTHFWRVPAPGTPIVQIDINPMLIGRNYPDTLPLLADARVALAALAALAPATPPAGRDAWLARIQELKKAWREAADVYRTGSRNPMRPEELAAEISDGLPADGILVSDTGHAGIWTGTMVELRHPGQRYIRCAGSLGWGLPGAMGVQCAVPDRKVILWSGDGGLYYHLAELETAARYGINLVVVCNNNSSLSSEYKLVVAAYGGKLGPHWREIHTFRDTNFAKVAESLGCVGMRVTTRSELHDALGHALSLDRPVVIDAVTDAPALSGAEGAVAVPPWAPPAGGAHA